MTGSDTPLAALGPIPDRTRWWQARRNRRRIAVVVAVALLLLAVGVVVDRLGAVRPQLDLALSGETYLDQAGLPIEGVASDPPPSSSMRVYFSVHNRGFVPVRVLSVGLRGTGAGIGSVTGLTHELPFGGASIGGDVLLRSDDPVEVAPGATAQFGVELRYTDCHSVRDEEIVATVSWWRGRRTVTVPSGVPTTGPQVPADGPTAPAVTDMGLIAFIARRLCDTVGGAGG